MTADQISVDQCTSSHHIQPYNDLYNAINHPWDKDAILEYLKLLRTNGREITSFKECIICGKDLSFFQINWPGQPSVDSRAYFIRHVKLHFSTNVSLPQNYTWMGSYGSRLSRPQVGKTHMIRPVIAREIPSHQPPWWSIMYVRFHKNHRHQ